MCITLSNTKELRHLSAIDSIHFYGGSELYLQVMSSVDKQVAQSLELFVLSNGFLSFGVFSLLNN